jgi:hypothetical protein
MISRILRWLRLALSGHLLNAHLMAENPALRQQLATFLRTKKRPKLTGRTATTTTTGRSILTQTDSSVNRLEKPASLFQNSISSCATGSKIRTNPFQRAKAGSQMTLPFLCTFLSVSVTFQG